MIFALDPTPQSGSRATLVMETPVWFIVPQMNGARIITVDMKESVLSGRASGQCDTRGH